MIRAFCFDLDETLVDVEPQHVLATRAMLETLGHPPHAGRDVFIEATGARTRDLIDALRLALGVPQALDELLALRHSAFVAALDAEMAVARPGAEALLTECRARGPVALVSSGHREDILETLRSAGIARHFDAIVTGDDVLEAKPAPEPYLVAASRLGIPPADILVFEDSARGVASALAAGCRVVAVPSKGTPPERVADATLVLRSLEDALPLDALFAMLSR